MGQGHDGAEQVMEGVEDGGPEIVITSISSKKNKMNKVRYS